MAKDRLFFSRCHLRHTKLRISCGCNILYMIALQMQMLDRFLGSIR